MTTDKFAAERRRNNAMNNRIRGERSVRTMPLDLEALRALEPDEPALAPTSSAPPPSVDAGAGTGGQRTGAPPSMNELLRDAMASELSGRRIR